VLLTDTYPFGGVGYGGLSPDGAVFAYVNGVYGLSTLHTDGTQLVDWPDTSVVARDCYNAGCATSRYLTWSPDGAQVAWISTASVAADGANQAFDNVWVADVAQNTTSRLTNFNAATIASNPTMTGPSWSADGTHIAFVSSQAPGADRTGAATVGVTNVWSVDVTTKALFCVTNFSTEYQLDMATYARGGTKVIFSSLQDPTLATGAIAARNLFGISDSGTGLVALTSTTVNGAYNRGPVWGPDNTTVLFESNLDPVHPTMTSSFQSIWKVTPGSAATLVHAPTSSWDYTAVDNDD
jgi:Tol biopolymer transport system component